MGKILENYHQIFTHTRSDHKFSVHEDAIQMIVHQNKMNFNQAIKAICEEVEKVAKLNPTGEVTCSIGNTTLSLYFGEDSRVDVAPDFSTLYYVWKDIESCKKEVVSEEFIGVYQNSILKKLGLKN